MALGERILIANDGDVVTARTRARDLADTIGFSRTDQTVIAAAVSEIARNIVAYAGAGEILVRAERSEGRWGILIVANDDGPGIADIDQALSDGYSTAGSLGVGLPGARRLMDSLEVESQVGKGTTVTMHKWVDRHG